MECNHVSQAELKLASASRVSEIIDVYHHARLAEEFIYLSIYLFILQYPGIELRTLHTLCKCYIPSPWLFETGFRSVAQAKLKLTILLPQPPQCWDYKPVPPWRC
jgi:hypothetical protein